MLLNWAVILILHQAFVEVLKDALTDFSLLSSLPLWASAYVLRNTLGGKKLLISGIEMVLVLNQVIHR